MQEQYKVEGQSQEEGFYPAEMEIRHESFKNAKVPFYLRKHPNEGPQFIPRYLSGNGIMKKQPPESLRPFDFCQIDSQNCSAEKKKRFFSENQHPYILYANSENYKLVYNRTKGYPISFQRDFLKNQIVLEHLGSTGHVISKGIKQFDSYQPLMKEDILTLDSRFESGNLHCAFKNTTQQEYICFIQNDTNSLGYNQWFYFSIQNNKANVKYQFRLVNFRKRHSFFKYGYKPAVFSRKQAEAQGKGWSHRGNNISYEQSPIQVMKTEETSYFCLSFDIKFEYDDDYILIAMGLPYSYSKMVKFLNQMPANNNNPNLDISLTSLVKSVCGNDIPELTLTSKEGAPNKRVIVIMARQHPGEVWASYMVEGIIKSFLNPKQEQKWLLHHYIIKIYPMVNVDGVIYGNFRCDVTGVDLNRRWKDTSRILHPQIFLIKKKISEYHRRYKVDLCYDLHGHSKDYNIFCYACKSNIKTCRILPFMISELNTNFHFPSCTFGITPYKQTTARACIYKIIRNQNVLTIQTSFYGSKTGNKIKNFQPIDIFQMSQDIIKASKNFLDKKGQIFQSTKQEIDLRIKQFLYYDQINANNSGSDSQPSADEINLEEKMDTIFRKNVQENQEQNYAEQNSPTKKSEKKFEEDILEENESPFRKVMKKKTAFIKRQTAERETMTHEVSSKTISHDKKDLMSPSKLISSKNKKKTISDLYDKEKDEQNGQKDNEELIFVNQTIHRQNKKMSLTFHPKRKKIHNLSLQNTKPSPIGIQDLSSPLSPQQKNKLGTFSKYATYEPQQERNFGMKGKESPKNIQKIIPIQMISRQHDPFNYTLYNEDQGSLIKKLLENKRKIEVEKNKFQADQSEIRKQIRRKNFSWTSRSVRKTKKQSEEIQSTQIKLQEFSDHFLIHDLQ